MLLHDLLKYRICFFSQRAIHISRVLLPYSKHRFCISKDVVDVESRINNVMYSTRDVYVYMSLIVQRALSSWRLTN